MIHINYYIGKSELEGVGLFTKENLKKGDLIYTPSPLLDVDIDQLEFDNLKPQEQKEVEYYGYFHSKTQKWHVAYDAIRLLNHSDVSNVTQDEDMVMVALCDVPSGSELVQNYREFLPPTDEHFKRIQLKSKN